MDSTPQQLQAHPLRVLLVEDNPDDLRLLRRGLARDRVDGIALVHVQTLAAAQDRLQTSDIDAILLDLNLPDSSGLETVRRVRAAAPEVPLVVLTGAADAALGLRALHEGAQDYLVKSQADGRLLERALLYAIERQHLAQEQAARSAAEEAVRARDEFLSVISHELYTPITALSLSAQSILRQVIDHHDPGTASLVRKIQIVQRQSDRLDRLVHSLLEVSRIHVGRFELTCEPADLAHIVRDVAAGLEPELHRSGSSLTIEGPPTLMGSWDLSRVEQIVTNLLSNAIKYGSGAPIEVRLAADDVNATLTVTDHGIGISPDVQARIFGRFERAVPTRQYGGLGLGLYLVQRIVRAHGGSVSLQSREGAGSTFVVVLPRGEVHPEIPGEPYKEVHAHHEH